jgi:GNAT superfamily N-acetyltransferase
VSLDGLAEVRYDEAAGVRWAIVTLRAPAAEVAPVALEALRGHRVVTESDEFVALLVAGGGTVQRRAHNYEHDLATVPPEWAESPAPQGFRLSPDVDPEGLVAAHAAAYPPGHPDHRPELDHAGELRWLLSGTVIGATVRPATWQLDGPDGPCGAVVVCERYSTVKPTGTWVLDVFVDPRHAGRGLGGLLLRRAIGGAAAAGYPNMGLVVTDANPARAVYERLGFVLVRSGTNVDLP